MQITFNLPIRGLHLGGSVEQGAIMTSGKMLNVRARDTLEGRVRIGQRAALVKWGDGDRVGLAEQPVVAMCSVSAVV